MKTAFLPFLIDHFLRLKTIQQFIDCAERTFCGQKFSGGKIEQG